VTINWTVKRMWRVRRRSNNSDSDGMMELEGRSATYVEGLCAIKSFLLAEIFGAMGN
jgi:hypothetical protein